MKGLRNQTPTLSSPTPTSQNSQFTPNQFKLITYIDRINFFSDTYIKYYKQIFDNQDFMFVVNQKDSKVIIEYLKDHGFNDSNFHVYVSRDHFGYGEQVGAQNSMKRTFLDRGYIVVYADIDELIYHPDFKSFIVNSPRQLFCSKGLQIVQAPNEPPLDKTQLILNQRTIGQYDDYYYAKVCVLKKDFTWTGGRHNKEGVKIVEDLWLLDIGKVCKNLMIENNKKTIQIYKGVFPRYKYTTLEELEKDYKGYLKGAQPLPAHIKDKAIF